MIWGKFLGRQCFIFEVITVWNKQHPYLIVIDYSLKHINAYN